MTWDTRQCPSGHLGTARRCWCGQDTKPWTGEGPPQTEFDKRVEEMLKAEKDRKEQA